MPSRRDILIGAGALGVSALFHSVTSSCAKASQPATPVDFEVPKGACDCHVHIFGDPQPFPFASSRTYTPESASVDELQSLHRALHLERTVVIQPSVYGTDNSCTLAAIKQLGSSARGIAVIDEQTPKNMLDDMDRAGTRGVRINLGTTGQNDPEVARHRLQSAISQIGDRKWHIQIYTKPQVIAALSEQITAAPMPIVLDHFGGAQGSLGVQQPGFDKVLELVRTGKAYVKISGAYRASTQAPDYADAAPLARVLIAANPQRILWGSDWPHPDTVPGRKATDISPLLQIDDGRILNLLATWAPEATLRKTILVDNPARLYGF
jgi:predicted TIM-barrel fold metal-dependent hydrolase